MTVLTHVKIILEDYTIPEGYIRFDEAIIAYGPMSQYKASSESIDEQVKSYPGMTVIPGFIDVHIHGYGGADTMDGTVDALSNIATGIRANGVTAFLATTMTMPSLSIEKALDNITAFKSGPLQAKCIGIHLEGPFINPEKKGAQNGAYIRVPSMDLIKPYLDHIRIITIAPEKDEGFAFIEAMKAYPHVKLSIGHTCADFETSMSAYAHGVSHITHCFNAMPPLNHRAPGVIGAMMSEDFTTELIADNIHVHPGLYKGLFNCVGADNLILITDSMRAGGMSDGEYDLGNQPVKVKDGSCRLVDGTLAGSILKMNEAVRNVIGATGFSLELVSKFASANPAKMLGLYDEIGSIDLGKKADLIVVDSNINIIDSYVEGK